MNGGKRHLATMLAAGAVAISACGGSTAAPEIAASHTPVSTATTLDSNHPCQATELAIRIWTKQTSPAIWEFDAVVDGLSRAEIPMLEAAARFDAVALRFSEVLDQAEPHTPAPDLAEAFSFFLDGLHEMEQAATVAATLSDLPVSGLPAEAITGRNKAVALLFESNAAATPCE